MKPSKPAVFTTSRAVLLIAANAIGTGIFTTTGFALRDLKSPYVVLSVWILGAIYSLLGVYSYSILHKAFPGSGGEYHFLYKGFNRYFGIAAGFITIISGFTAPLAASCYAFATYFLIAMPVGLSPTTLAALVLTFIFLIHFFSLHKGMKWHDSFIYFKLLLFLILTILALFVADWRFVPWNFEFTPSVYAGSFFWIAYAYSGWNAVYYVASELTTDEKKINLASLLGTILVSILYIAINLPLLFGTDTARLEGVTEVIAAFFNSRTGFSVDRWVSALVAIGLLSTISAFLVIVPRIYSRMAQDKVLPKFFYFAPGEHPRRVFAAQYALTLLMLVIMNFDFILRYAGFVLTVCSLLSVVGLFYSRAMSLNLRQIVGTTAYIALTSLLVFLGGPWF